MPFSTQVLVVDDDTALRNVIESHADECRCSVHMVDSLAQARSLPDTMHFQLALLGVSLPDGNGLDLLDHYMAADHIVVAGQPSVAAVARVVGSQASEYLIKPLASEAIRGLLQRAAQGSPDQAFLGDEDSCGELIGQTTRMRDVFREIRRVASTDATVLITGESGTGKEMAADAIHRLSGRKGEFVAINCAAVPVELLASELFGHEKGSFTGAHRQHIGCFERASGGTVFLDEITEMPLSLQAHLLRVLETRTITRVGGQEEQPLDIRVIAACNRDPQRAVEQGHLREDLLYRLLEFPVCMPPLRERGEDVPLLAQTFLNRLNRKNETSVRFSNGFEHLLIAHDWPGNVRELLHCVRRAHLMADGNIARVELLSRRRTGMLNEDYQSVTFAIGTSFESMQRTMLLKTLKHFQNDKTRCARALGVSVKTIYNHLGKIGLNSDSTQ
jgi:DNA-binding NtrC family response regulator